MLYFRCMNHRLVPTVFALVFAISAFAFAVSGGKPTLIIFTGSDWCNNCRYLEKTVLIDTSFVRFASENTRLIIADFPQKTSQPDSVIARNDSLASLYNHEGTFPKIVLQSDTSLVHIPFHGQKAAEMISEIKKYLP